MKRLSIILLIVANFVPILGVIFLSWNLFAILFLYWAENIVVGIYNILKMLKAEQVDEKEKGIRLIRGSKVTYSNKKSSFIMFFLFHYGLFTIGHGVFVFTLFGPSNIPLSTLFIGILSLFVSHGISYLVNFIGKEEYRRVSPGRLFGQPYKRIIIMHITVLFGGFVAKSLGSPLSALLILVLLKTVIDIASHVIEHKNFSSYKVITIKSSF